MKKILLLIICCSVFYIEDTFCTEVSWMYVQHRAYEDGKRINRLRFGLIDNKGQYLATDSSVADVKLYDPNGKLVKLSPVKFGALEEIYGLYDTKNSQWEYRKDSPPRQWRDCRELQLGQGGKL
jgi:hypothetical protein